MSERGPNRVRVATTKTMTVHGSSNLNVGTLRSFLDGLDENAVVRVNKQSPDRPGELVTMTIEVTVE